MDTMYYQLMQGEMFILFMPIMRTIFMTINLETDYNGNIHFEYLRKGDYTLYTYADSSELIM